MSDKYVHLDRLRQFSETISATIEVIRQCFKPVMLVLFKVAGPWIVVGSIGMGYAEGENLADLFLSLFGVGESRSTMPIWVAVASSILSICATVIASTSVLVFMLEYHRLQRVPMVEEVRLALRGVWGRAFGGWFVTILLVVIGYFMLIIPGIYLSVALCMVVVIQLVEGATIGAAIKRSVTLVQNDWWWAFGFLFLLYCCAGLVSFVADVPGTALMLVETMTVDTAGETLTMIMKVVGVVIRSVSNIVTTCVTSLVAAAVVVLYFREVERTEGGGLLGRINAIGADDTNNAVGADGTNNAATESL